MKNQYKGVVMSAAVSLISMFTSIEASAFSEKSFGKLSDGTETKIWRLVGRGGLIMDVTDYGGRIVRVYVPDRNGNLADVTLGWNSAAEYEKYGYSMGTLIGRFGNRIADGKFVLDGNEYQLECNESKGPRHCNLHGGPKGWDTKVWSAKLGKVGEDPAIKLSLVSPDMDQGFPGEVKIDVVYSITKDNTIVVSYEAITDKPTVINPTHHGYWNLAGESSGNVLSQYLQINADEYTSITDGLIPVKNVPVKDTAFDFTVLRKIDALKDKMAADEALKPTDYWYDHNFMLRGNTGEMKHACTMYDPVSGREMQIWTTEPAMQMYGAQNMDGTMPAKKAGVFYPAFAGMALETQHCPDSPNHPEFPSTKLIPGKKFSSKTEYRFTVK
jgi:aldose 1-epimerase